MRGSKGGAGMVESPSWMDHPNRMRTYLVQRTRDVTNSPRCNFFLTVPTNDLENNVNNASG